MTISRVVSVLLVFAATLFAQNNPVPFLNNPLSPGSALPGGKAFTLTVNGTGFVGGSSVNWNGTPLATTFVSRAQLTARVPAADIAIARTASVTVTNPVPGGGLSNIIFFPVVEPVFPVYLVDVEAVNSGAISVTADFNNDGNLDLAGVNESQSSGAMNVLLGNGDGTFQRPRTFATESYPSSIVTGDFNRDGILDLAVGNALGYSISIFLGKGNGNFSLATTLYVGTEAFRINAADYNADGNLDLATTYGPATTIFLGNGDGTFQSPITLSDFGIDLVTADFNHDGKLDLAILNYFDVTQVSILFGNGDGTFQTPVPYSLSAAFFTLTVGDFNGDGNSDLAFADDESAEVSVLLGNADGTFGPEQTFPAPASALFIKTADIDGDGKLDLLSSSEDYGLSVLMGNGDGTFQGPITFSKGFAGAIGDFNKDGKPDVAGGIILLEGPLPAVALNPTEIAFRTQSVDTISPPQPITLTNTGNAALSISNIVVSGDFVQTNTCGSSVAGGASCTINVTFTPYSDGKLKGAVTVTDNALISPQTVPMFGVGTYVTLKPALINFGDVRIHTSSAPQTVTLNNTATTTLTVRGVNIVGLHANAFSQTNTCGTSVPAGGTCTITVTFRPPKIGKITANLDVFDSSGRGQGVPLKGKGTN